MKTLSYGSGTHRYWPEFAEGAVLRTEPVDASRLLKTPGALKTRIWQWRWGIRDHQPPLNGTVWHPDGPGPYPLVLCVHGNHQAMDRSDTGYAYLGELLASRGFIFVSVDENFLDNDWGELRWGENAVRGWLLLKHLEVWRRWNRETDNPFFGRVDLNRIALIGHSRGGEAAANPSNPS